MTITINKNILKLSKFILIIFILFIVKITNQYKSKLCLCIIGKRENRYAIEYINYYKNLGYDHIFIYDNNDINGENFLDIFQDEIKKGFVSIIDYRGYLGKRNLPQFDAYFDCYKNNYQKYDWLSFFDFDEYLELKNMKIRKFLNNKIFRKCQVIKINWIMYSDNDLLHYENKSLQKRFSKGLLNHRRNILTKSIVRGNLSRNYWTKILNPHTSGDKFVACSASGKMIDNSLAYNNPIEINNIYLKHYSTKTVEEFCNKIRRGMASFPLDVTNERKIERINYFFEINKKTKEKIDIIKQNFNISFN